MTYIAIEGLDGAGKSTAKKAFLDFYKDRDIEHVREPGGTVLAEKLRSLVKEEHEGEEFLKDTETCMFFGARFQLLGNVVIPALKAGKTVISDRCYLSTVAYQGSELVDTMVDFLPVKPDLILYLDVEPLVGLERARSREELDRIEKQGVELFDKAREVYKEQVKKHDNIIMVDGNGTIEETYKLVYKAIEDWEQKNRLKKRVSKKPTL